MIKLYQKGLVLEHSQRMVTVERYCRFVEID